MLSEGKTGNYLKYGIGEVVLVVIGILIALQINNWNEHRKLKVQELSYLNNLKIDLLEDKEGLKKIIERRISKVSSSDSMLSYYNGTKIKNLKDYYYHFLNVLIWDTHRPNNITFQELINSGKLTIIQNPDIKKLLLEIKTDYEDLFTVRSLTYDIHVDFFHRQYASIFDYESGIIAWEDRSSTIDLSEEDVKVALKNRTIKNGFALTRFNNMVLRDQSKNILDKVLKTIRLIEIEIGNN